MSGGWESMQENPRSGIEVVAARDEHLDAVARLHLEGLPRGFLSRLGPGVLSRLYAGIARQETATVLVALDDDGSVLGFVSGTTDVRGCYGKVLRRDAVGLGLRALPHLIRPANAWRVLETLTYPLRFRGSKDDDTPDPGCTAELLSISVDGRARGRRVGRSLVETLEDFLCERASDDRYRVVTDAEDPQSNAFYERTGFARIGTFLNHGHPMVMYVKSLNGRPR